MDWIDTIGRETTFKRLALAGAMVSLALGLASCGSDEPDRDQIPLIKDQIVKLEKFYRGEPFGSPDSLMTTTFYADLGKRGYWQALAVDEEVWPFVGFTRRSFEYTNKKGKISLSFLYKAPDNVSDTTRDAQVFVEKRDGLWKVSAVKELPPIVP